MNADIFVCNIDDVITIFYTYYLLQNMQDEALKQTLADPALMFGSAVSRYAIDAAPLHYEPA